MSHRTTESPARSASHSSDEQPEEVPSMRRVMIPLVLIGLILGAGTLSALAGGGIAPPGPGTVLSKPTFRALIMLDPHNIQGDVFDTATSPTPTSGAKQASVQ